jgi:hypothetical protein
LHERVGGGTYTTALVTTFGTTGPVVVLNQGVEDTTNTEGWLDDVRSVLSGVLDSGAALNGDQVLADLDLAATDSLDIDDDLAVGSKFLDKSLALLLGESLDSGLNGLTILLEVWTELLLVKITLPLFDADWLVESLADHQRSTGLVGVHGKIVCTSVGTANALNPAVAGKELGIPAVSSVMGHLVSHVLSEADLGLINTDLLEEEVDSSKEVTKGLVIDKALSDSLTNSNLLNVGLTRQLSVSVQENKFNILDLVEAWVLLATLWVNKVLNLSHQELSYSEKTSSW